MLQLYGDRRITYNDSKTIMSYFSGEDEWFQTYDENDLNRQVGTPEGTYYEAGNIDNIPLNDEGPLSEEFDLGTIDNFQYGLSPNGGLNGHHQQPGPNGNNDIGGQFQNMHSMPNPDTYNQHMQPSTSGVEYNTFEMPTVISSNMDGAPYELVLDDPNSFYANQQPSTSQGNDMMMNENYDMMGQQQQSTSYMPQMDHGNPSSVGNPSSHSNMGMQMDNNLQGQQPPPPKPKPKKKSQPKKKPQPAADTVGNVLLTANRVQQQNNAAESQGAAKVETRLSPEEVAKVTQLMFQIQHLKNDESLTPVERDREVAKLEGQVAQLFSSNVTATTGNSAESIIIDQLNSKTNNAAQMQPPRRPPQKKKANNQHTKNAQNQQQQSLPPQHAQMIPLKVVMEPPTTTMVPGSNQMNNMYNDGRNENYAYQQMDEPGTSHQNYNNYQQSEPQESLRHHQNDHPPIIQMKVVQNVNQRPQNYRQGTAFTSRNTNGPGPSPLVHRPQSHENHHMEQIQDQQYHPQDHQRPQSRHMYVAQYQQNDHTHQREEPTLGEIVRQTQGRYQGPQDTQILRQQLISNVNATNNKQQIIQRNQDPTPSPGHFHNNNVNQQQYGEYVQPQGSYPSSHDMQPHSHSQQGYEKLHQYETAEEFYEGNHIQSQNVQMVHVRSDNQHQHYEQQGVYMQMEEQVMEPEIYYPEVPEVTVELSKEKLAEKLEERRLIRQENVKTLLLDQLKQLDGPVDVTPFRGKMDILERMLPYHHLTAGEEPVSNFDSTFEKTMTNTISNANAIGNRIRNIVLRESMHSFDWEQNMILFLETESEKRKLEDDRNLAKHDVLAFAKSSDIIRDVRSRRLNLEHARASGKVMPEHVKELGTGKLSAMYSEYEFDSYDENRPRGSPLPFIHEEFESETETEPEKEEEEKNEVQPTRSDISPLVGFPQPSPVPSLNRFRNESESTADWKDDDESPLLSPDNEKFNKVAAKMASGVFGKQDDPDKSVTFPFNKIGEVTRKHHELLQHPRTTESVGSSVGSSSTAESTPQQSDRPKSPSPKPSNSSIAVVRENRSISPVLQRKSNSIMKPSTSSKRDEYEGSPEIGDDYSNSPTPPPEVLSENLINRRPAKDIPVIPLPVAINAIKLEKDDTAPKLKLRFPASVLQKGIKMAASEDNKDGNGDDDVREIPIEKREPLKLKLPGKSTKSKQVSGQTKLEENSLTHSGKDGLSTATNDGTEPKSPVFKTPLVTPSKKASNDIRKRRGEKIEDSPNDIKRMKDIPSTSSFVTPNNRLIGNEEPEMGRFLRTMTDGSRIIMKIGKIPNNINHFVTPRRDAKGNLHKNLSPTKDTRLKMRFYKKDGELAVEVTERVPQTPGEEPNYTFVPITDGPSPSTSTQSTPVIPASLAVKGRPAPAHRKQSVDSNGKDKKNNVTKGKSTFQNRFNPFASVPSSSKSTTSTVPSAVPKPTTSAPTVPPKMIPPMKPVASVRKPSAPIGISTPSVSYKPIPQSAPLNLIKTTPIIPKIKVTNAPEPVKLVSQPKEVKNDMASLLPWMFSKGTDQKKKPTESQPVVTPAVSNKDLLKVRTEPSEVLSVPVQQESPRASSALSTSSISFFEADGNSFEFLKSPKRTNEPLPVVEFSDDEEDDLVHSTFSHATDHLLATSNINKPVNGAAPFLPWSTDS